jgi:hypothetical protein
MSKSNNFPTSPGAIRSRIESDPPARLLPFLLLRHEECRGACDGPRRRRGDPVPDRPVGRTEKLDVIHEPQVPGKPRLPVAGVPSLPRPISGLPGPGRAHRCASSSPAEHGLAVKVLVKASPRSRLMIRDGPRGRICNGDPARSEGDRPPLDSTPPSSLAFPGWPGRARAPVHRRGWTPSRGLPRGPGPCRIRAHRSHLFPAGTRIASRGMCAVVRVRHGEVRHHADRTHPERPDRGTPSWQT